MFDVADIEVITGCMTDLQLTPLVQIVVKAVIEERKLDHRYFRCDHEVNELWRHDKEVRDAVDALIAATEGK